MRRTDVGADTGGCDRQRAPGHSSMTAPTGLRVEHLDQPLGIGDREPRLSWKLPADAARQLAYRIRTDTDADSGWLDGEQSVLVPWPFAPLGSRHRVGVQVQGRTDRGDSNWSGAVALETGLLDPEDWTAIWVRPPEDEPTAPGCRPAYELRGAVAVGGQVARARLYATAYGLYEVFVNGRRVGDHELTPGYTQYDARLQAQAFDVTDLVVPGSNEFTVLLSDGWFRGQVGTMRAADQWGERTAFLAQLHVDHPDGGTTVAGTDASWSGRPSHLVAADLIEGQSEDRRLLGSDGGWTPAVPAGTGVDRLVWSPAPPVRRVQELPAVTVTRPAADRQVVDLGRNINGWVRLTRLGPAETTLTLTHGEALGPDGDVTMTHLAPDFPFLPHPLSAGQVDRVVSAGRDDEVFEPRHTTHGFQYVRVEGHPQELTSDDVTGVVVHTDMRRTGWFSCSNEKVNRLHEAAVWSFRDNACDVPTDCPTRERAGWTGDWQLYVPTAAFCYDVAGFSTKWLRDLTADQWDNGIVANMSPCPRAEGRDSPLGGWNGSAGGGDAAVVVPWGIYRAYGDVRLLAEQWPSMVAWLDFVEQSATTGRHPDRIARSAVAAPHERYLWDTGFHWGEWLVPGEEIAEFGAFVRADEGDVATAYFAHSADLMSRIARLLERPAEAARYAELADNVRAAWRTEFVDDGRVQPDTQANLVRALTFELVPDHLRERTAARLVELIRAADTHLATGFLATPDLLPVLADHGYADVAYELLLQDTAPSWMTMLDRGATTVWERWEGIDADGCPHESLNHYSKGAVIGFLHRYTAGIRLGDDPAYRTFRIEPVPGGGITSAAGSHDSPYGRITSSWTQDGDSLRLVVEVPPGTRAEIRLPGGASSIQAGPGHHEYRN